MPSNSMSFKFKTNTVTIFTKIWNAAKESGKENFSIEIELKSKLNAIRYLWYTRWFEKWLNVVRDKLSTECDQCSRTQQNGETLYARPHWNTVLMPCKINVYIQMETPWYTSQSTIKIHSTGLSIDSLKGLFTGPITTGYPFPTE